MNKVQMAMMIISLSALAVIAIIAVVAWVIHRNRIKTYGFPVPVYKFLMKSERGREILENIKVSQAELERARLDAQTGETNIRVLETERKIVQLKEEVSGIRMEAEENQRHRKTSQRRIAKESGKKKTSHWVRWGWWIYPSVAVAILVVLRLCGLAS